MKKQKRRPFFIKGNFQIAFIGVFILLLLSETAAAGLLIYRLSAEAIESAVFSSHLAINQSAQIIKPIILKVNGWVALISILLACVAVTAVFFKLHTLFSRIIAKLKGLRDNKEFLPLPARGGKNTRKLIAEFNQAGSALDQRLREIHFLLDSLTVAEELSSIHKLHGKLHALIAGKE